MLWYRVTGDERFLDDASATARSSLAHFGSEDRLWNHAPCFNAILLRNLVTLHAVRPVDGLAAMIDAYADRLWNEGRDQRTGWFTRGGIGRYERGGVLDQGGVVQILALPTFPDHLAADLV